MRQRIAALIAFAVVGALYYQHPQTRSLFFSIFGGRPTSAPVSAPAPMALSTSSENEKADEMPPVLAVGGALPQVNQQRLRAWAAAGSQGPSPYADYGRYETLVAEKKKAGASDRLPASEKNKKRKGVAK